MSPDNPSSSTHVEARHLSRFFGTVRALDDVSFSIIRGAICAISGPNGAGKSTLLRCLAGLLAPEEGSLTISGKKPASIRIGFCGAQSGLYADLSVGENLELAGHLLGDKAAPQQLVDALGLGPNMHKRVRHCSQGTVRRAGIARALIGGPELLLLDEPFANLDTEGRMRLKSVLESCRSAGRTVFFATHDLQITEALHPQVLTLDAGRLSTETKRQ